MGAFVTITKHTTASKPYPHVLYVIELVLRGIHVVIERRYSEVRVYFNISLQIFLTQWIVCRSSWSVEVLVEGCGQWLHL